MYLGCFSLGGQVYAVGPDYAHAEARKSPVVDGKVLRNARGKESRYPLILHSAEKEVARKARLPPSRP